MLDVFIKDLQNGILIKPTYNRGNRTKKIIKTNIIPDYAKMSFSSEKDSNNSEITPDKEKIER